MLLLRRVNHLLKLQLNVRFSPQLFSSIQNGYTRILIQKMCLTLSCTEYPALTLYKNFPSIRSVSSTNPANQNIELLMKNGVSKESIADNQFLLILKLGTLERKLEAIKQMKPNHIDDFIPLLAMKGSILKQVAAMAASERYIIPEKSRIYYLSNKLQVEPATVSKYCSKHELMFSASFDGIVKKLNILQDYNVDSNRILQSLYVFRCADQVFISRIEELHSNGLYDIKLWFFKCTDKQFRKVLVNEIKNKNNSPQPSIELVDKIKKRNLEKLTIVIKLNEMLSSDDKLSAQIYYNFIDTVEKLDLAKDNITFLIDKNVSLECIKENPIVLTLPFAQVNDNLEIIQKMKPNAVDDFFPLIEVSTSKLKTFQHSIKERLSQHPETHPIYIFCKNLNLSPTIVSKYFAKHSDVFLGNFTELKKKLDLLLAYNVQPLSILKSPHTFRMAFETIEETLENIKSQGIENISSWMLVCDTLRMETIVARLVEEKKSFGEFTNTVDYVAERLNWDDVAKEKAIKYYPPLAQCSILKVIGHLDYLLNETHFSIEDINANVSVFRTNLDELKLRFNELHAIGLTPRKLYSLCLSRERYLEMVERFCKKKKCPVTLEAFRSIEERIRRK